MAEQFKNYLDSEIEELQHGGGLDWSDIEAPAISFFATTNDADFSCDSGTATLSSISGQAVVSSGSNSALIQAGSSFIEVDHNEAVLVQAAAGFGVTISGDGGSTSIHVDDNGVQVGQGGSSIGFYGISPITPPNVSGTPTLQEVVNALKALGLITQV